MRSPSFIIATVLIVCGTMHARAEEPSIQSTYEIADLAAEVEGLPPPVSLGIQSSIGTMATEVDANRPNALSVTAILARFCDPGLAADIEATTVIEHSADDAFLIVRAAASTHLRIADALRRVRAKPRIQIVVQTTFFLMDLRLRQERFAFPTFHWRSLGANGQAIVVVDQRQDLDQIELLSHDAAVPENGISVLKAAVSTWSGQRAQADFTQQFLFQPVVFPPQKFPACMGLLRYGDTFSVLCRPREDGHVIDLHWEHHRCVPTAVRDIDLGACGHADQPVLWFADERVDLPIPDGSKVVIATGVYLDGSRPRAGFMVVTPARVL